MSYSDRLEGIGGWLAFFLVTLGVFTPLGTVLSVIALFGNDELAASYGPLWPTITAIEGILAIAMVGLACFAVFRFFCDRNWRTVQIGIAVLWLLCATNVVIEPVAISLVTGIGFGQMLEAIVGPEIIRPFIYAGIWTAYLLNSERVSNTYRYPEGDTDGIAEVFE